jgi:MEMO1 family protein
MKLKQSKKIRDTSCGKSKKRSRRVSLLTTSTTTQRIPMSFVRPASHAAPNGRGWYEAIPERLKATLDGYFSQAMHHYDQGDGATAAKRRMTALIAPHAGMSYSGPTAAEAFAVFRDYLYAKGSAGSQLERVFIIGPCHVKGFDGCELSAASAYETPFGPLRVDVATVDSITAALRKAGVEANKALRRTDEAEHSIEMETPYLSHILHFPPPNSTAATPAAARVSIVPIIVGWTERSDEKALYNALKPYMDDAKNFFVFSSDFCHWGERFSYTYHYKRTEYPNVGDAIIAMDHAAMDLLEHRDLEGWYSYLKTTRNTICGRAPISVGMHHWAAKGSKAEVKFVHYAQSNKCEDVDDSSVSYAAAVIME